MNNFLQFSVKIIFLTCFFFEACHGQETNETQCLDNDLSPDNEPDEGTFETFATELEYYTGLGTTPFVITLDCGTIPCIINPNGTAIWEARMHLYSSNMMHSNNGSSTTLDGCLCYSKNTTEYETCMNEVRESMTSQLETVLVAKFKEIVENNCTSFEENCHP